VSAATPGSYASLAAAELAALDKLGVLAATAAMIPTVNDRASLRRMHRNELPAQMIPEAIASSAHNAQHRPVGARNKKNSNSVIVGEIKLFCYFGTRSTTLRYNCVRRTLQYLH